MDSDAAGRLVWLWLMALDADEASCALVWGGGGVLLCLVAFRNAIHVSKIEQANEFADRLMKSKSLTSLDLAHNHLGDDVVLV